MTRQGGDLVDRDFVVNCGAFELFRIYGEIMIELINIANSKFSFTRSNRKGLVFEKCVNIRFFLFVSLCL